MEVGLPNMAGRRYACGCRMRRGARGVLQAVNSTSQCVVITYGRPRETDPEYRLLREAGHEIVSHRNLDSADAAADLARCAAIVVGGQFIDAACLDRMPNCKVVTRLGVGYENVDVDAATTRGIRVTYCPDYGVHEVSTHAIAMMLAMARNMDLLLADSRAGRWKFGAMGRMERLQDQVLGVLGFGRIGRETAIKGRGLGMTVLAHDPVIADGQIAEVGIEPAGFAEVVRRSDYLSLHVPAAPETRQLIDANVLAQMKPGARIINTARGSLIDEDALLAAIQDGRIAGAALDVLHTEPPPADHPLLHEPNVITTPHAAWYSEGAKADLFVRCAQDVIRVLAGEEPVYPLNEV